MERGSRLKSLLDSLDKLNSGTAGKSIKSKEDELSQYRYTTAKILQCIESQDKLNRDTIVKNATYVTALLHTIQIVNDRVVQQSVFQTILELIGKTNSGKRASIFINNGATVVLFNVLVIVWKETPADEVLITIHQILWKLGQKDRKFGVKARLCQALPVTAGLIRQYSGNNNFGKPLQTLLSVLRLLCHNQQNATYLGRNGVISLLFRIVSACGKRYLVLLKLTLDTLTQLVKSKSNSARAIGQNAVPVLIDLFTVWYRTDTKNRHIPLRKAILNVLRLLANLKSGRSALLEHDGLAKLYDFCELGRGVPELETMVLQASLVLRKCFPRNRLPVPCYTSVLRCPLPESAIYPSAAVGGAGDPTQTGDLDLDAEDSPFDEDDDVSSGEEGTYLGASGTRASGEPSTSQEPSPSVGGIGGRSGSRSGHCGGGVAAGDLYTERSLEDLIASYEKFFPELLEFQSEDASPSDPWSVCVDESVAAAVASAANGTSRHMGRLGGSRRASAQEDALLDDDEINGAADGDQDEDEEDEEDEEEAEEELDDYPSHTSGPPSFLNLELTLPSATLPLNDGGGNDSEDVVESSMRHLRLATNERPRKHSSPELSTTARPGAALGTRTAARRSGRLKSLMSGGQTTAPVAATAAAAPGSEVSGQLPFLVSGIGASVSSGDHYTATEVSGGPSVDSRDLSFLSKAGARRRRKLSAKTRRSSAAAATLASSGGAAAAAAAAATSNRTAARNNGHGMRATNTNNNHDASATAAGAVPEEQEEMSDFTEAFVRLSAFTRSLGRFSRIGYPDLIGSQPTAEKEVFAERSLATQQAKVMDDMRRIVECEDLINKVVYDLDQTVARDRMFYNCAYSRIANEDETKVDHINYEIDHLLFDSQFESGNLRKAIQVRQYEYDLILNPDIGTNHHVQWFYFRVSNIEAGVPYRFNIINCEKPNSQFNFGMRPVVFSVREALYKRGCWRRMGEQICYYKNHYARSASTNGGVEGRSYYTTSFCLTFPHEGDICYVAYHYPYTYSQLRADLELLEKKINTVPGPTPVPSTGSLQSGDEVSGVFYRCQNFCQTILGNDVQLLTVTATPRDRSPAAIEQLRSRPYIILTARVHPGESNSSWVMRGTIHFLLSQSPAARLLREQYIFKIVPMLNPDGVINGNHRCSMSAEDLNRKWLNPCPALHPTIFHTKGLIAYLHRINRPPLVFCDYHGHSRKKNVFMYGCSPAQSWITEDTDNPAWIPDTRLEDTGYKVLPRLLQSIAPAFSLPNCSYVVDKAKETTARVVVWRQFRVLRSYTMESTYCGCDQGIYRGLHVSTRELEEMGCKFCEALLRIRSRHANAAVAAAAAAGASGRASDQLGASSAQSGSCHKADADSLSATDSKNAEGLSSASGLDDVNEDFDTAYEDDSDDTGDSGDEDWFDQSDAEEQEDDV